MHRIATTATIATALVLALVAGPAGAFYDEELELEFVESVAWFTPTTTGIANVDQELGEAVGWSSDAPAGSGGQTVATSHAGLASIVMGDEVYETQSFLARGTVTGHLENIALDLYYTSPTKNLCGMGLSIDLTIDGVKVMDMEGIGNTADVASYQATDDHFVAQVALTDIHEAMVTNELVGDETTEHQLEVLAQMYPLCQEAIWTYGTAEAPSSLTFNVDPASSTIRVYTRFDVTNPPAPSQA